MMREAVGKGLFQGLPIGSNQMKVELLQYANGTIFIGKAKVENFLFIKSMLRCFELVSSLKINFFKSSLRAIGLENDLLTRFAGMLNCRLMHIPFLYLGIPMGAIHRK